MSDAVVLRVDALDTPALEDGQQPGIALGLQSLVTVLLYPAIEQETVFVML